LLLFFFVVFSYGDDATEVFGVVIEAQAVVVGKKEFLINSTDMDSVILPPRETQESSQLAVDGITTNTEDFDTITVNPYAKGCLYSRLSHEENSKWKEPRVCNSDDARNENKDCIISELEELYPEIRIYQGSWDTSMIMAWLYQILLMEVARVPATVGLTTRGTPESSFYASSFGRGLPFSKSTLYPYEALKIGNQVYDCSSEPYEECANIFPEVWPGQRNNPEYLQLVEDHVVEPSSENGVIGRVGLYMPFKTLKAYPQFASWVGLQGNMSRRLLASIFKRPTTWGDYCQQVSPSKCSSNESAAFWEGDPMVAAARYPEADEFNLYIKEGVYRGHFRYTEENNCTAHPDNCTGHVVFPPCDFASSHLEQQLYWNDIVGLASSGPFPPSNSYDRESMLQIWRAAYSTGNHLLMAHNEPELYSVAFMHSEYAFYKIQFPTPSRECSSHRVRPQDKCSEDRMVRVGSEKGACGDAAEPLRRIVTESIQEQHFDTPDADQSPAYAFLKDLRITTLDMQDILDDVWSRFVANNSTVANHHYGLHVRVAICDWVVANADSIWDNYMPPGYPRTIQYRSNYNAWYMRLAQAFGCIVAATAVVAFLLCSKYSNTKVILFARPDFMKLISVGFCMTAFGGGTLHAMAPTSASCTGFVWVLVLGFTIEMIPVIVKTAAINKLIRSARRQQRVNISRSLLLARVAAVVTAVIALLITWTVLSGPDISETRRVDPDDPNVIVWDSMCDSDMGFWRNIAFAYHFLLLMAAALLAYQSRDTMKQLNESRSIAWMIYSHFMFLILQMVFAVFYYTESFPASTIAFVTSLNYSFDTLVAMAIYIFPKLAEAMKNPVAYRPGASSGMARSNQTSGASAAAADDDTLQLLICTANIGNAKPTMESLEAWIPPDGSCAELKALKKGATRPDESFGVIAIGMQEATWKDKKKEEQSRSSEVLTEDEVLNAMEEKNTAQLREMIQEILGDGYIQVADEQRGQMRLHIWVSAQVELDIQHIKISGANAGIGNVLANKGGITATFDYKKTRVSFLTGHLAAHEGKKYYKSRCDNIQTILGDGKTSGISKKLDVSMASHHTFVFGDLNFRTDFGDENLSHEDQVERALEMIENKDFTGLYSFDELQKGLANGDLLVDFQTLPCNFSPTFKVEREPGLVYKKQRTPSYADRILFKTADGMSDNLEALAYEACVDFITSDHKPVRGAFSITPNEQSGSLNVGGRYTLEISDMKCSNLDLVTNNFGKESNPDPYIMFLWDSNDLRIEGHSFMDKLRLLWRGQTWPRTRSKASSRNPDFGDENLSLFLENCEVWSDQMLFVAVHDYDPTGPDYCLGVAALNIKELLSMRMRQTNKVVQIDRPLLMKGKHAGEVGFQLTIKREQFVHRRSTVANMFGSFTHGHPHSAANE